MSCDSWVFKDGPLHRSLYFTQVCLYVGPLAVSIMGHVDVPLTFWAPFVRCLNSLFVLFSMSSLLPVLGNSAYRILYQLRRRPSSSASLLFVFIRNLRFLDAQVGIGSRAWDSWLRCSWFSPAAGTLVLLLTRGFLPSCLIRVPCSLGFLICF